MKHPVLKYRIGILIYFAVWILVTAFEFLGLYPDGGIRIILVLIIQNIIIANVFLGAWYSIRYIKLENQNLTRFITNHLIHVALITLISLGISELIEYFFFGHSGDSLENKLNKPVKGMLFVFMYLLFVAFIYLDSYYNSFIEKQKNEQKLLENIKTSELNLLKTQMNPHFLFNSLNSISSLTMISPEKAQNMIIKLSDFLRYTVNASKDHMVSLEQELDMCEKYLEIEKVRFGDKIIMDFKVSEDTLNRMIPGMILHTLFENAIKHGVYESLKPIVLRLETRIVENRLEISLQNEYEESHRNKKGTQTGLKNIKNRLDLIYDQTAIFEVEKHDGIFTVKMNLP